MPRRQIGCKSRSSCRPAPGRSRRLPNPLGVANEHGARLLSRECHAGARSDDFGGAAYRAPHVEGHDQAAAQEEQAVQGNAVFAFLVNVSYKRRIFEVFLDAFLITLSYYAAFVLVTGSLEGSANWELFLKTWPLLVFIKLASFLVVGVYRGFWRYTSIYDLRALVGDFAAKERDAVV